MSPKKADRKQPEGSRWSAWILAAGLFVSTLAAYWNSFWVPFVFDDLQTIQRNASVRFGEFDLGIYPRAILFKTFTLNYLWSGQEVWSYHIVNFILHFLNGLLVFVIAGRILRKVIPSPSGRGREAQAREGEASRREAQAREGEASRNGEGLNSSQIPRIYAALAAGFFLLHPVQTESVTYISTRSELLSTFFYLAGFLVFAFWPAHSAGFLCSLAVGIPYFLGVGSKETAITLPATIFLYDFLFLSKAEFRPLLSRWRFYLIYVLGASATIYFLLTVGLADVVGGHAPQTLSSWPYFLTETRVLVRYIRLIFLPAGLNLDYDFAPSSTAFEPAVLVSLLFLSTVLFIGWWLRRRAPVFSFSIFWFFITLSPTSSVVSIADVIFEHRLYLPLAGVAISFPLLIEFAHRQIRRLIDPHPSGASLAALPYWARASRRLTSSSETRNVLAYSSVLLVALLVGTLARNYVWGDEVRLFTDVLAKSPLKERPYNALAWAYYKRGEYDHAAAVLEQGLDRIPDRAADLEDALGNMYLRLGEFDKAVALFQKESHAVTGEQLAVTYNNLGMAYLYIWTDLQNRQQQMAAAEFDLKKEQVLEPAAEAFSKALEIQPSMTSTVDSYINVMCWRGRGSELEALAIARLKKNENTEVAHLTPAQRFEQFSSLYTIGKVAFNNGDYAKADKYFEQAEKIKSDVKIVFFNHGYALTALKQDERAIDKYTQAIRVEPIFIEAHHNLGLIYMNRKEYAKAIESFTEVLRLEPKYVSAHLNLASIYVAQGKRDLARQHLSTVLAVSPGNQQAEAMVQQLGL